MMVLEVDRMAVAHRGRIPQAQLRWGTDWLAREARFQLTRTPKRLPAMAAVWPGMVLLRPWRSRAVVRLHSRRAKKREKNFMTHLHAIRVTPTALIWGLPSASPCFRVPIACL